MKWFLFYVIGFLFSISALGQIFDNGLPYAYSTQERESVLKGDYLWNVGLGMKIELNTTRSSGFRIFTALGGVQNAGNSVNNLLLSGQLELEIYKGGIGSSLSVEGRKRIHFDLRFTPQVTYGYYSNNSFSGRPLVITTGQAHSALLDPTDYSFGLATTFSFGLNHSRHQQYGSVQIGLLSGQLTYSNDGPPFHWIGFGSQDISGESRCLGKDFLEPIEEETGLGDASEVGPEEFDLCVEGLGMCIGGSIEEEGEDGVKVLNDRARGGLESV